MSREKKPILLTPEEIIEAVKKLQNVDLPKVQEAVDKEVLSRKEKLSNDLNALNGIKKQ